MAVARLLPRQVARKSSRDFKMREAQAYPTLKGEFTVRVSAPLVTVVTSM